MYKVMNASRGLKVFQFAVAVENSADTKEKDGFKKLKTIK